ncbi:unnamed protein product [Brassica oleracea var. botrytis]|uniref:(rape) hypothetical protein n=1 Tax=Brassica napus TaxID=3708 RepID=A0A078I359_BRANA|nr:unnamed protein product [Brassica napus]CDY44472.1 BnaCnng11250D [Brassica napus]
MASSVNILRPMITKKNLIANFENLRLKPDLSSLQHPGFNAIRNGPLIRPMYGNRLEISE